QSNSVQFQVGVFVTGMLGWRDHYVASAASVTAVDTTIAPLQSFLGAVGMPGRTAYFGFLEIGQPKAGETVFVSAAAGAVGSIVCQIAKIKGCRVVASAGSDQKVAWLLETAGVDAAFNYKNIDDLDAELRKHCPDGLDIYFENVGGRHLQAALAVMNMHGRIPLCGMISQYNDIEPTPGPTNLSAAIGKRIRLQGFIVTDFMERNAEFYRDMREWIGEGRIQWEETIIEGLENAPKAFIALFTGEKLGKIIVKVF
ncbi:NADP-dependent oxidoreductase, partial [Candidatus Poribacteria bacterium]|nr:NADP-dependent oxidoreductase [Candidatus Poribacteria bacterium]